MTTAQILAGNLTANLEERVVSGLLLPFGEIGQTNLGRFSVDPGVIQIPSDLSTLMANEDHSQLEPRARFLTATETPAGIVASFKLGTNPEDNALLARIDEGRANGKPIALSAEVKGVLLKAGKAIGGKLTGAAFVARGAFASAALMAAAVDIEDPDAVTPAAPGEPTTTTEKFTEERTDGDGNTVKYTTTRTTVVDGDKTTITEKTVIEEPETPADGDEPVGNATVPGTLVASAPTGDTGKSLGKADLFAMIAEATRSGDDSTLMAALSDVKISGAGTLGLNTILPEFIGEVWSGKRFQRRVIPLLGSGTLTSLSQKGYRFVTKPEVSEWAGNKTAIPSNSPTTEPVDFAVQRFAAGWDIGREFFDFGETAVIEAFLRLAADSYAKKSDAYVLAQLLAGATAAVVGTLPTGVGAATASIIRGALRVIENDGTPNYAIVAPNLFEELAFTKKDDTLALLNLSLGLEEGQLDSFKIVPHSGMAASTVLVGDRLAASAYELPGSPIRVSAIDIVKGGIDEALHGYIQARIEYPLGLQLVTPPPAV